MRAFYYSAEGGEIFFKRGVVSQWGLSCGKMIAVPRNHTVKGPLWGFSNR